MDKQNKAKVLKVLDLGQQLSKELDGDYDLPKFLEAKEIVENDKININQIFKYNLTDYGRDVLKRSDYKDFINKVDDYYCSKLWCVMYVFGSKMYMGNEQIFVGNVLKLNE